MPESCLNSWQFLSSLGLTLICVKEAELTGFLREQSPSTPACPFSFAGLPWTRRLKECEASPMLGPGLGVDSHSAGAMSHRATRASSQLSSLRTWMFFFFVRNVFHIPSSVPVCNKHLINMNWLNRSIYVLHKSQQLIANSYIYTYIRIYIYTHVFYNNEITLYFFVTQFSHWAVYSGLSITGY